MFANCREGRHVVPCFSSVGLLGGPLMAEWENEKFTFR